MAVNLLTYDNYTIPKLVVTSNIDVVASYSTLYITTNTITATNLSLNAIYAGTTNNSLQFRGLVAGTNTSIISSNTTLLISCEGIALGATSLGNNAIYAGTTNNTLQFLGITSLTTLNVTTTTNLIIDMKPSGVTAGTYGSTSTYPIITVDTFGRATAVSTQSISKSYAFLSGNAVNYTATNTLTAVPNLTATVLQNFTYSLNILTYTGSVTKYFLLHYYIECDPNNNVNSIIQAIIYKNNVAYLFNTYTPGIETASFRTNTGPSLLIQLAQNDNLRLLVNNNGGPSPIVKTVMWTIVEC